MRKILVALVIWCAALPAWAAEEGGQTFLFIPTWIWKTVNMLGFFALLVWLLAKPMRAFFHTRRESIAQALDEAKKQQAEAERLKAEVGARVAALESEIQALRDRLRQEGEREREALERQGEAEAARLLAQMDQEAARRVEEARGSLAREAANVAAELAWELLEKELTPADRERIFTATLDRLRARAAGGAA